MRRYDIVFGIPLILSIINFALAAPVPVQEKRQAFVDVAHIPKDVITVSGKRSLEDDMNKLVEELSKTWAKSVGSSDAHASSISALPEPDRGSTNVVQAQAPDSASSTVNPVHGSTDVVQAPAENPASSTAYPGPLTEPPSTLSTTPVQDSEPWQGHHYAGWESLSDKGSGSHSSTEPIFTPTSSMYGSDNEWAATLPKSPNPNLHTLAAAPFKSDDFDWNQWTSLDNPLARPLTALKIGSPKQFSQTPGDQMGQVQQLHPGPSELTGPDPNFNWEFWETYKTPPGSPGKTGLGPEYSDLAQLPDRLSNLRVKTKQDSDPNLMGTHDQPPPYPGSPTMSPLEFDYSVDQPTSFATSPTRAELYSYTYPGAVGQLSPGAGLPTVPEHELVPPSSPDLGSSKTPENEVALPPTGLGPLEEPDHEVVHEPPPTPDSESQLDYQSPSTVSQLVDPEAVSYAMKGKAKAERRVSVTTRDAENAACTIGSGFNCDEFRQFLDSL